MLRKMGVIFSVLEKLSAICQESCGDNAENRALPT